MNRNTWSVYTWTCWHSIRRRLWIIVAFESFNINNKKTGRQCNKYIQSCEYLNINYFRFRCGCTPVPVNLNFAVISPYFAEFENVVHSLEPGETPSNSASHQAPNYSASHQAPNYAQRFKILQNISKRFGEVAVIFSIYLKPALYNPPHFLRA